MERWWPMAGLPLLFFWQGLVLMPYPGIQNDEVLFAVNKGFPLMILSYLGGLKAWILGPIAGRFLPFFASIRVPILLFGALTVVLFILLVESAHSRRAAIIGGILLATDTMFLMTTCFDWGPVALQHVLMLSGMLLILKSRFFWGFFSFGLAMWDKALFLWMLAGLVAATVSIFRRELWQRFTRKNVLLAGAGFFFGALPLIVYNVGSGGATFRVNSALDFSEFRIKARALQTTWNGTALFGFIANNPDAGSARDADSALERASFAIQGALGDHRANWLEAAFGVALLLALWLRRRVLMFCLVTMAVAWLLMAITKGAGIAVHHAVLLWPIPHLFLAVAFAEASVRWGRMGTWLLVLGTLLLASGNLMVTNQYLYQLARYGGAGSWTDAIYPLSAVAGRLPAEHVVVDDWGILSPLQALDNHKLPLVWAGDRFLAPGASDAEKTWDRGLMEHGLWLGHTPAYEQFRGSTEHVVARAAAAGFRKELVQVVADRNGRAVFEVFRFRAN